MTIQEHEKFVSIMNYLDVLFPNRKLDAQGVEIYFDVLSDFDVDDIFRAVKSYAQTGKHSKERQLENSYIALN